MPLQCYGHYVVLPRPIKQILVLLMSSVLLGQVQQPKERKGHQKQLVMVLNRSLCPGISEMCLKATLSAFKRCVGSSFRRRLIESPYFPCRSEMGACATIILFLVTKVIMSSSFLKNSAASLPGINKYMT